MRNLTRDECDVIIVIACVGAIALICSIVVGGCSLIEEIIIPDTPDPTPTPEPTEVYHEIDQPPVWHGEVTDSTTRVGVLIASPSMVRQYYDVGHDDHSSCIEWVRFHHAETGTDATYTQQMMEPHNQVKSADEAYLACPDGANNWTTADDYGNPNGKWYAYLTGYPEKEPGADGTYRGYCWVPAPPVGEWSTWIRWRTSGNRAHHTYVGMVYERGSKRYMLLYHWNQRGDGGTYEVQVGEAMVFGGGG